MIRSPCTCFLFVSVDTQEYIRRQLEEEQRHLEMLQEQLLREQAMLLVSTNPSRSPAPTAAAQPHIAARPHVTES